MFTIATKRAIVHAFRLQSRLDAASLRGLNVFSRYIVAVFVLRPDSQVASPTLLQARDG
jgi:hypothetical protein